MVQNGNEKMDQTSSNQELTPWLRQRLLESKANFVQTALKGSSLGENSQRLTTAIISRQQSTLNEPSRIPLSEPISATVTDNTSVTSNWEAMTLLLSQSGRNIAGDDNSATQRQTGGSAVFNINRQQRANQSGEQPSTVRRKEVRADVKSGVQPARAKFVHGTIDESPVDIQKKTAANTTETGDGQPTVTTSESDNRIVGESSSVSPEVPEIQKIDAIPSVETTPDTERDVEVNPILNVTESTQNSENTGALKKVSISTGVDRVQTKETKPAAGSSPAKTLRADTEGNTIIQESTVETPGETGEQSEPAASGDTLDSGDSSQLLTKSSEGKSEAETLPVKSSPDAGTRSVQSADSSVENVALNNIGQITNGKSDTVMKSGASAESGNNVQTGKSPSAASRNTFLSVIKTVAGKIIGTKKTSVSDHTIGQQQSKNSWSTGSSEVMRTTMATSELTGNNIVSENIKENAGSNNVDVYEQVYDNDDNNETKGYTSADKSVAEVSEISGSTVSDGDENVQETGQLYSESTPDISRKEIRESLPDVPVASSNKNGMTINKYQKVGSEIGSVPALSTYVARHTDTNYQSGTVRNGISAISATVSEGKILRPAVELSANDTRSISPVSSQPDEDLNAVSEVENSTIPEISTGESLITGTGEANVSGTGNRTIGLSVTDSGNTVSRSQATTGLASTSQVNRMYRAIDLPVQRSISSVTPLTRNGQTGDTSVLSAVGAPSTLDLTLAVPGRQTTNPDGAEETTLARQISNGSKASGTGYYTEPQQAVTYVNRAETESAAVETEQTENRAADLKALARDIYPYIKKIIMIEKERLPNL